MAPDDFMSRLGRFVIARQIIEEHPRSVALLLSGMVVVRAEQRWDMGGVEYVAVSDGFEPVPEGTCAPDYWLAIEEQRDDVGRMVGVLLKLEGPA